MAEQVGGFDEFVVARGQALLRLAFLLTGDRGRAEDLVQESLTRLLPRWAEVARVEHPDAYVRRVIVNEFASWRRRRSSSELVGALPLMVVPDVADGLVERDAVWRALLGLPRRQRAVLVLRYYEQRSDAEIAVILDVPAGTVRSLASRGLAALRRRPEWQRAELCAEGSR